MYGLCLCNIFLSVGYYVSFSQQVLDNVNFSIYIVIYMVRNVMCLCYSMYIYIYIHTYDHVF